jgi:hypothetical protein
VIACGAASLALVSGAAAITKHPQLLGVDRTGGTVLLDPWTGQSRPYRSAIAAEEPFFSPDGMRVAFTKKVRVARAGEERTFAYELWVARWDGSMAHLLSRYGDDPTWSPDGRTIAFTWTGPDPTVGVRAPPGIYLIPSGGGTARRVLPPVVGVDAVGLRGSMVPDSLTWSPDGRWIAFEAGNGGVWIVHPDGTRVRSLASPHDGRPCEGSLLEWITYVGPYWLRGGRLAYTASVACSQNDPHATSAILAIRPDGSRRARILGPPLHPSGSGSEGVVLTSVAPDGISMTYYDQSRGGATIRLDGRPPQPDPPYNVIAWRPR